MDKYAFVIGIILPILVINMPQILASLADLATFLGIILIAFAYFDFINGEVVYTEGVVAPKINKIVAYPDGWITKDNSWNNTWAQGQNSNLGWPSKTSGNGVRELGVMLSRSRAFSECMSTKVYELVCLRTPTSESEKNEMRKLADIFQQDESYNMKNLIAETTAVCVEE